MARPVRQLPEPARFWIAFAVRRWRGMNAPWTDLAGGLYHPPSRPPLALPELDAGRVDDLLYLPPVAPSLAAARDRLAAALAEEGIPVLLQLRCGERCAAPPPTTVVYDLLGPLLSGELACLSELPAGSCAAWPLVPGISDRPELWREGLARLRDAGAAVVQACRVEIEPAARSRLAAERSSRVFDALFHGTPPSERAFARLAHRHGIAPFLARPTSGATPLKRRNRQLAAALLMAGELTLRLGRSLTAGHALLRAARGAEETEHDLTALVREGNLGVLGWLDEAARGVVEEMVTQGRSSLVEELSAAYLEPEDEASGG